MTRIRFEVLPDADGGWSVTRDRVVVAGFPTKDPAVKYAARCGTACSCAGLPAQLLIKDVNGRIRDERTYGNDPRDIPG